jgi:hypothetical protein
VDPSAGAIGTVLRELDDWFDYTISSSSAHDSMSSSFRHIEVSGTTVPDPNLESRCQSPQVDHDRATRHSLGAAAATAGILTWPHAAELREFRDQTISRLEAKDLPPTF